MPYTNALRPREGREPAHLEVQQMTTERNPEMSRCRSFERRAREEVERIKAEEVAEEEHKQARMRELAEQARERREVEAAEEGRRKEERDAKLRRSQDEKAEGGGAAGQGSRQALVESQRREGGRV
jgi:hypothetical protein